MTWQILKEPAIQNFITANKDANIKTLALNKSVPQPRALILDQIKARQKAALKLPHWQTIDTLIYPPADIIEQASSHATATYKASLINGNSFADLTTGSGADSFAIAQNFKQGHCVERDETLADILNHNAPLLSKTPLEIHCASAEEFIQHMPAIDTVYIDPQRRNNNQRGIFSLTDCSPNILDLLPHIKAKTILLKTSPMLDLHQATKDLKYVSEIHVIDHNNSCKELLFLLKPAAITENPIVHAITLNDNGTIKHKTTGSLIQPPISNFQSPTPGEYLYEPTPALQKAALFSALTAQYPVYQLAPNTNLFNSKQLVQNFPGRAFTIQALLKPSKKAMPAAKANLTIRNYPESVDTLKKKLALKDGGNDYLFACTLNDGTKTIIHCKKPA